MQLQVGGDGRDPWASLISSLFTSEAVSRWWGSSPGWCEHMVAGAQGRTPLLGQAWLPPTAPRGGWVCQLTQAAPEGVTIVWVGAFILAQLWSCWSRPQAWQESKGGDEHPREEGRGSRSSIFRAFEEGQRAGASKPCSFFQARPSYRSLIYLHVICVAEAYL